MDLNLRPSHQTRPHTNTADAIAACKLTGVFPVMACAKTPALTPPVRPSDNISMCIRFHCPPLFKVPTRTVPGIEKVVDATGWFVPLTSGCGFTNGTYPGFAMLL